MIELKITRSSDIGFVIRRMVTVTDTLLSQTNSINQKLGIESLNSSDYVVEPITSYFQIVSILREFYSQKARTNSGSQQGEEQLNFQQIKYTVIFLSKLKELFEAN